MKKPKILFLVPLPPPFHGASIQSRRIVESRMLNSRFHIRVLPLRFTREIAQIGRFSPLKILKMLVFSARLGYTLLLHRPRLVYYVLTHRGYSFYRDCLFVFIIKLWGAKIVFHQRNKGASDPGAGAVKGYLRRRIFKNTYSIILSPLLVYDVEPFVPRERIFVVPNGIPDVEAGPPGQRGAHPVPTLLFLSNLIVEKGVLILLEALSRLKEKGLSFTCIFAGEWSYNIDEQRFRQAVQDLNVKDLVKYVGPVYGKEKIDLLNRSDIFVFPTYMAHETFGNVVLEAMRASLPVVASDEASLPFIVEDRKSGFVCQKKDAVGLAEKLEILIRDRNLREKMGKNGRKRYLTHFTFEIFEQNLARVLEEILGD